MNSRVNPGRPQEEIVSKLTIFFVEIAGQSAWRMAVRAVYKADDFNNAPDKTEQLIADGGYGEPSAVC